MHGSINPEWLLMGVFGLEEEVAKLAKRKGDADQLRQRVIEEMRKAPEPPVDGYVHRGLHLVAILTCALLIYASLKESHR